MIPKDHPRYESLILREKMVQAYKAGILAEAGMIAHGRGEAFDYLIGEKTTETAKDAIRAAASALILAKYPVISVNGNTAALVPEDVVRLSDILGAKIEINLFYKTPERMKVIEKALKNAGACEILGTENDTLESIGWSKSPRANVSSHGIFKADVVLVPLEDGDRTEALRSLGKFVIAIDLNPLSRTSKKASITIVDNILRTIPTLVDEIENLREQKPHKLRKILEDFDNTENLKKSLKVISERCESL